MNGGTLDVVPGIVNAVGGSTSRPLRLITVGAPRVVPSKSRTLKVPSFQP